MTRTRPAHRAGPGERQRETGGGEHQAGEQHQVRRLRQVEDVVDARVGAVGREVDGDAHELRDHTDGHHPQSGLARVHGDS